jgi:hypothetical protein
MQDSDSRKLQAAGLQLLQIQVPQEFQDEAESSQGGMDKELQETCRQRACEGESLPMQQPVDGSSLYRAKMNGCSHAASFHHAPLHLQSSTRRPSSEHANYTCAAGHHLRDGEAAESAREVRSAACAEDNQGHGENHRGEQHRALFSMAFLHLA